ncbi:hypothetical protein ACFYXM_05535 [Streptomyces sp. NPDC002476]|uniref:hypothetical protein n=1 Tax=Streptomyces sp. NPDC002476 TaxID=3364648 RepID=UPI0036B62132
MADITDDMISAEKRNKNVWDLYGQFGSKSGDGWFANDPVDGALGIMGREPENATGYLDPKSGDGSNGRLTYLLKDRDWDVVNTTRWSGNVEITGSDTVDEGSRVGLGAAIEAGATGHPAGDTSKPSDGKHTVGEARVMQQALSVLDEGTGGDQIKSHLRDPLARALVDYAPDTHSILTHDPRYAYTQGVKAQGSHDLINQWAEGRGIDHEKDPVVNYLRDYNDLHYSTARNQALADLHRGLS